MFIRDFSWTHEIGHRPEVELKISNVNEAELMNIRELAAKGEKIEIKKKGLIGKEIYFLSAYPEITIPSISPADIMRDYIKNDVERTKEMFNFRFGVTKVEKVIFNKPATIVFWSDGTKTVVKCGENDEYDKEKGFYIACAKKLFGNDYKAVGRMNKALEMGVVQTKEEENE